MLIGLGRAVAEARRCCWPKPCRFPFCRPSIDQIRHKNLSNYPFLDALEHLVVQLTRHGRMLLTSSRTNSRRPRRQRRSKTRILDTRSRTIPVIVMPLRYIFATAKKICMISYLKQMFLKHFIMCSSPRLHLKHQSSASPELFFSNQKATYTNITTTFSTSHNLPHIQNG